MRSAADYKPRLYASFTPQMQKPQLVAADTNILFRLADGHGATIDAWHLITRLDLSAPVIASPEQLVRLFDH